VCPASGVSQLHLGDLLGDLLADPLGAQIICHSNDIVLGQNRIGAEKLTPEYFVFARVYF
jgi:hypothetical protein